MKDNPDFDYYLFCDTDFTAGVWMTGQSISLTCRIRTTALTQLGPLCSTFSVGLTRTRDHEYTSVVCSGHGLTTQNPVFETNAPDGCCSLDRTSLEVIEVKVTFTASESLGDWTCGLDPSNSSFADCTGNVTTGSEEKCKGIVVETFILGMRPTIAYVLMMGLVLFVFLSLHLFKRYKEQKFLAEFEKNRTSYGHRGSRADGAGKKISRTKKQTSPLQSGDLGGESNNKSEAKGQTKTQPQKLDDEGLLTGSISSSFHLGSPVSAMGEKPVTGRHLATPVRSNQLESSTDFLDPSTSNVVNEPRPDEGRKKKRPTSSSLLTVLIQPQPTTELSMATIEEESCRVIGDTSESGDTVV